MARIRSRETKPEITVRNLLSAMGYRYSVNVQKLAGTPDIVLQARRKIVFVHGCFWHRHPGCALARIPKSHKRFWIAKLEVNRLRDGRVKAALRREGWSVATVWECQLKDTDRLTGRLRRFIEGTNGRRK
ncbi:MAG: very short patch repair endonuclease [Sulfuritalea sp.]|nr:very short patch repair endonuclease [Sulfuritalea sp.]